MAKKLKKMVKGSTPAPRKAKAKPARPPRAATARVSASIEKDLLLSAGRYAAAHRTTLAAVIAEGLRKVVGAGKAAVLPPGNGAAETGPGAGPWAQLIDWMEEQQSALTEIRNTLGDVAASLPNDAAPGGPRPAPGPRIPPL